MYEEIKKEEDDDEEDEEEKEKLIVSYDKKSYQKYFIDDVKKINRNGKLSSKFVKNRNVNCCFCTLSYELRRRGFDVTAENVQSRLDADGVMNLYNVTKDQVNMFSGADFSNAIDEFQHTSIFSEKIDTIFEPFRKYYEKPTFAKVEELKSRLLKEGNSRGNVTMYFGETNNYLPGGIGMYGGHSIAYEVHNGKIWFIDAQLSRIMTPEEFGNSYLSRTIDLSTFRTDNAKINIEEAKNYVRNTKTFKIEQLSETGIKAAALTTGAAAIGIRAGVNYVEERKVKNKASKSKDKKEKKHDHFRNGKK